MRHLLVTQESSVTFLLPAVSLEWEYYGESSRPYNWVNCGEEKKKQLKLTVKGKSDPTEAAV